MQLFSPTHWLRYVWITIGGISFVLGTIGIFLPILPTVPFYMLTVFCLAKGSTKLHAKFTQSSLYKKHMADFMEHKSLTMKKKLTIIITVSLMMAVTAYMVQHVRPALITIGCVWIFHTSYLLFFIKTRK